MGICGRRRRHPRRAAGNQTKDGHRPKPKEPRPSIPRTRQIAAERLVPDEHEKTIPEEESGVKLGRLWRVILQVRIARRQNRTTADQRRAPNSEPRAPRETEMSAQPGRDLADVWKGSLTEIQQREQIPVGIFPTSCYNPIRGSLTVRCLRGDRRMCCRFSLAFHRRKPLWFLTDLVFKCY